MRAVQAAKEVNGYASHEPPPLPAMDGQNSLTKQIDGCMSTAQALLRNADKGVANASDSTSYIDFLMHQGVPLLRMLQNPNAFAALWLLESLSAPASIIADLRHWLESGEDDLKACPSPPEQAPSSKRRPSALKGSRNSRREVESAVLAGGSASPESETSHHEQPSRENNVRKSIMFWQADEAERSSPNEPLDEPPEEEAQEDLIMQRLLGGPTDDDETHKPKSRKSAMGRDRRKRFTVAMESLALEALPEQEAIELLRRVPTFAKMSEDDIRKVASIAERKLFGQDETIVNFGDSCQDVHIVLDGSSKVSVPQQISMFGHGSFFGEESLRNEGATHTTQIVATGTSCTTLSVNAREFKNLGIRLAFERTNQHIARNLDSDGVDVPGIDHCENEMSRVVRCENFTMTPGDRSMIIEAVKKNKVIGEVLSLSDEQYEAIADEVYLVEISAGTTLIQKGANGADLYIVQEGLLEVFFTEAAIAMYHFRTGDSFGEIGLLYDSPRTATVKAQRDSKAWVLHRSAFRLILRASYASVITEYAELLKRIPVIINSISDKNLDMAAGALEEISFMEHDEVCEEGQDEGILFICFKGECNVLKDGKVVRTMQKGDWIGELQLSKGVAAEETVKVKSETAVMLVLDIAAFHAIVNALANMRNSLSQQEFERHASLCALNPQYMDHIDKQKFADTCHRKRVSRKLTRGQSRTYGSICEKDPHDLKRCHPVALLGQGSFGTVAMFKDHDTQAEYAVKRIFKEHVLKEGNVHLLCNERNTQILLDSDFIVRLYRSYQDAFSIFFMLEPVLGGELFNLYNDHNLFGDVGLAQFYMGCISLGLHHMHLKRIIYRDLKLENCLLDERGYLKLTDMGIAKVVIGKTYTICGTVDYFAPETLKQIGHNRGVDWWACGVLLFIMLSGRSPFDAPEVPLIYKNIIKGFSKVRFPDSFNTDAVDLIKSLCRKKPEERVTMQKGGIENLKEMAFFRGFCWEKLASRSFEPPFLPPPMDMEPARKLLEDKGFEDLKVKVWDGGDHEVDGSAMKEDPEQEQHESEC